MLQLAERKGLPGIEEALHVEEQAEREADKAYWAPLRAELERLRHGKI